MGRSSRASGVPFSRRCAAYSAERTALNGSARVARKGACGRGEADAHRDRVERLDGFEQLAHAVVLEIVVAAARDVMERMLLLPLPLEREQHVLGVHRPRGREVVAGVEGHVGAQMEGVFAPVLRNLPAFREPRHEARAARLELDQAVEHRARRVHAGCRRDELRVERFRIALRAEDERLRKGRGGGEGGGRDEEGGESGEAGAHGGDPHWAATDATGSSPRSGARGRSMTKRAPSPARASSSILPISLAVTRL